MTVRVAIAAFAMLIAGAASYGAQPTAVSIDELTTALEKYLAVTNSQPPKGTRSTPGINVVFRGTAEELLTARGRKPRPGPVTPSPGGPPIGPAPAPPPGPSPPPPPPQPGPPPPFKPTAPGLEDYREGLEQFRGQLDTLVGKGVISKESYRQGLSEYQRRMELYREAVKQVTKQ